MTWFRVLGNRAKARRALIALLLERHCEAERPQQSSRMLFVGLRRFARNDND